MNMVTMLDCIARVPERLHWIVEHRDETFAALRLQKERLASMDEIVLIGSGTSNTSAITARFITEHAAGIRVTVTLPTEFLYDHSVFNPNALYVFISQTGTSAMTRVAMARAKKMGLYTVAVSEGAETPAAREADLFVNMGCGVEEYGMRTIGYSTSILTLVMLGVEMGRMNGRLSAEREKAYVQMALDAAKNIPSVIEKSLSWMDRERRKMLRSDLLMFTGSGALAGVAMEASIKVWETPQISAAYYELEEGLHAPNYGYSQRHCVIVLNDGGPESDKAVSLSRFTKCEMNNGFMIGKNTVDEHDLTFEPQGGELACLEFAAAIQVAAYRLAVDQGRDLIHRDGHGNMSKYFSSHRDVKPEELA